MTSIKRTLSDDDSDDDSFLNATKSTFSNTRASRSSKEAKKARRAEAMRATVMSALKSGEQQLKHETRLDELHQRSSEIS